MSNMRRLSFLHHEDIISYNGKIYKVDWDLDDNNNVVEVKTNKPQYIDEYKKVKWLRNYNNITLIR